MTRNLLVSTARDEGPFLLEWFAYHRMIGFTDFLIYSNDCSDGTDQMLDRLQELGLIKHFDNPRKGKKAIQWQAMNRAAKHPWFKNADWIYATDLDEFLCIHVGDGMLQDLLDTRPDATGFFLTWRMFGNTGQIELEDRPVTDIFRRAAPPGMVWPWRARHCKSLFRGHKTYKKMGVHRPLEANRKEGETYRWYDGSGRLKNFQDPGPGCFSLGFEDAYALAQINHYALGAADNFVFKRARGKPNHEKEEIGLPYWIDRNFINVEDNRLWERFGKQITSDRDDLLSDPVLGKLHRQSLEWRQKRVNELLMDPDYFYLRARALQIGPTRVLPPHLQVKFFNDLLEVRRKILAERPDLNPAMEI